MQLSHMLAPSELASLWRAFNVQPPLAQAVVRITPIPGCGNGMVAASDIARGQELLRLPLDSCLSVRRGPRDSHALAEALQRAVSSPGPWQVYRSELMPARPVSASMLWTEAELAALQHGPAISAAREAARRHCAGAGASRTWALTMVCSRSFELEAEDGGWLRAQLPFIDCFNHLPESPAEYAAAATEASADEPPSPWSLEGCDVVLRASQPTRCGEEVLIPYGVETNAGLLATHGFSMGACNSAEYVPLFGSVDELLATLSPGLSPDARAVRRRLWSGLDASEAPLAARPGGDLAASAHVLGAAQLALAEDGLLDAGFEERYDADAGHYVLVPRCADAPLERLARVALARAARGELARLLQATTLAQDERALARLSAEMQAAGAMPAARRERVERALVAVQYRLGVKQLLSVFADRCTVE